MTLLAAHLVSKTYRLGRVDVPVLRDASIKVEKGEWVAVLGASGSGKSTLLHLLGGLDRPDRAAASDEPRDVHFEGRSLGAMSQRELDRYRTVSVGFVFQFYHLLPELSVAENAALPAMVAAGRGLAPSAAVWRRRSQELLDQMGLAHRLKHRPAELSGGERQRVAIARALVNNPAALLADEPTGNLDRQTGERILDLLAQIRAERGQTIVMVTHDPVVAARADRVLRIQDGRVVDA